MPLVKSDAIRSELKKHHDGLTAKQLGKLVGRSHEHVTDSLSRMVDAYIDRWTTGEFLPFEPVWCVVEVPENCPHPAPRKINRRLRFK